MLYAAVFVAACSAHSDVAVDVQIDAPDDYIRGGLFELRAVYDGEGGEQRVAIEDRVLESGASFVVDVPGRDQWV